MSLSCPGWRQYKTQVGYCWESLAWAPFSPEWQEEEFCRAHCVSRSRITRPGVEREAGRQPSLCRLLFMWLLEVTKPLWAHRSMTPKCLLMLPRVPVCLKFHHLPSNFQNNLKNILASVLFAPKQIFLKPVSWISPNMSGFLSMTPVPGAPLGGRNRKMCIFVPCVEW